MNDITYKADGNVVSTHFDFYHHSHPVSDVVTNYHYHDFYEIYCFVKGNLDFMVEGRQYDMQPGNILLIHYHDLHQAILYNAECYERFYFWIPPAFFEKHSTHKTKLDLCFSNINQRRSRIITTTMDEIQPFFDQFAKLNQSEDFGNDILQHSLLLELLIFINHKFIHQEEELDLKNVKENPLIRDVIDYIGANLEKKLSLECLSQKFFVSKAHLSREFKRATGFTLHTYILKRKLLYSKKLLLDGHNANEIFHECGFINYSHFIKAFKKEFDITPKAYQMENIASGSY